MKADPSTKQGLNGSGPAEDRLRVLLAVAAFMLTALCWTTSDSAEPLSDDKRYFNIPQQRADLSLTQFAEQAGLTLLFKFNIAKRKTANNLTGHYTVNEAVEVLLADTGLHPVFSDQGQLMSVSEDMPETEGGSMDTKKKAGLVAVLAGVLAGGVNAQELKVTEQETQTSVVIGRVTDARTGANLRGAKVTIEETGQWTSTGDFGRFRFASVPNGSVTLIVSFLGYAGQSAVIGVRGDSVSQDFALRGGSEIEEIVVFGRRSARAVALNSERTNRNISTVVSSDVIGESAGATLSDALRTAPGIAFVPDSVTGEGRNIIIRGLSADLNSIRLNGIELGSESGSGRSPTLTNILADSIDTVVINKSLLASHDSAGIGGVVEITTKSPLDRPQRFFQVTGEFGDRGDGFGEDQQFGAIASYTFEGKNPFGISFSVQARENDTVSLGYDAASNYLGYYLPSGVSGLGDIDPRTTFPFDDGDNRIFTPGVGLDRSTVEEETISYTLSSQFDFRGHTSLRVDWVHSETERALSDSSLALNFPLQYTADTFVNSIGETRTALVPGGFAFSNQNIVAEARDITNDTITFTGESIYDRWSVQYGAGFTNSKRELTNAYSAFLSSPSTFGLNQSNFISDEAVDPVEGIPISLFPPVSQEGFPTPFLSGAGINFFNSPDRYIPLALVRRGDDFGQTERYSANLDFAYDVAKPNFDRLEFGGLFEKSEFQFFVGGTEAISVTDQSGNPDTGIGLNSEFGVNFVDANFSLVSGAGYPVLLADKSDIIPFIDTAISLSESDQRFRLSQREEAEFNRDRFTEEEEIALYVQAILNFGDLEIIPGLRYSSFETTGRVVSAPRILEPDPATGEAIEDVDFRLANTRLVDSQGKVEEWLPRIAANYEFSENLIARAGYFRSFARPRIAALARDQSVSLNLVQEFGPNSDQPFLRVQSGNPSLEPALTDNYDLSLEYYWTNSGVFKVSLYYKNIEGLVETNANTTNQSLDGVVLPDDPRFANLPDNLFIERTSSQNNPDDSEIFGIELVAEQQFTWLSGAWSGLGVFANYNYADSEKTQNLTWFGAPGGPLEYTRRSRFNGSPEHSGAVGITYNKYGFDGTLSYFAQSVRASELRDFGFQRGEAELDRLDLRVEYRRTIGNAELGIFFEGSDLLKDDDEPVTQSINFVEGGITAYEGESFIGGRALRIGGRVTF